MSNRVSDLFAILRSVVPQFLIVAEFYALSDEDEAFNARAKINLETFGLEPFHADICTKLLLLEHASRSLHVEQIAQCGLSARKSIDNLLDVLDSFILAEDDGRLNGVSTLHLYLKRKTLNLQRDHPEYQSEELECEALLSLDTNMLSSKIQLGYAEEQRREEIKEALLDTLRTFQRIEKSKNGNWSHHSRNVVEAESVEEWKSAVHFFQTFDRLRELLTTFWRCSCPTQHSSAKIHLAMADAVYYPPQHVHLLHFENGDDEFWRSAKVALDTETSCTSVQLCEVSSLCRELHLEDHSSIIAVDDRLLWLPPSAAKRSADARRKAGSPISLKDWLGSTKSGPSTRERLLLALLVAYAYLHLSGSEWWPDERTNPEIWLLASPELQTLDMSCLFIATDLNLAKSQSNVWDLSRFLNPKKPSLPSLGKLLMQIYHGTKVLFGLNEDMTEAGSDEFMDMQAAKDKCERTPLGRHYLAAVEACLGSGNESLTISGPFKSNERARMTFISTVIKQIQYAFEVGYGFKLADYSLAGGSGSDIVLKKAAPHTGIEMTEVSILDKRVGDQPVVQRKHAAHHGTSQSNLPGSSLLGSPINKDLEAAEIWWSKLESFVHPLFHKISRGKSSERVRVAVLDTGAHFDKLTREKQYKNRLVECRTWYNSRQKANGSLCPEGVDEDGHGSHVASLVLRVAPECAVYVAQVFRNKHETQNVTTADEAGKRIAEAIRYAVDKWNVDIITMSFGFDGKVEVVEEAIQYALNDKRPKRVLFFAAASDLGVSEEISWPARRSEVLCIHAGTGYGQQCSDTLPPSPSILYNFMTLGNSVEAKFRQGGTSSRKHQKYRSGTSIATPIAAGIAALVVDLLRRGQSEYISQQALDHAMHRREYENAMQALAKAQGMSKVFEMMAQPTQNHRYHFLLPWKLLHYEKTHMTALTSRILERLKE